MGLIGQPVALLSQIFFKKRFWGSSLAFRLTFEKGTELGNFRSSQKVLSGFSLGSSGFETDPNEGYAWVKRPCLWEDGHPIYDKHLTASVMSSNNLQKHLSPGLLTPNHFKEIKKKHTFKEKRHIQNHIIQL